MPGDQPQVVGREEELARIADFVGVDVAGPCVLVLQGEAGIGKTTLWREGLGALGAAGHTVLKSAPAAGEASLPYSTLADLLGPVYAEIRTDLPAPQRRAIDIALALVEPDGPTAFGDRLLRAATLTTLRKLAELGPVCLAVDDVQWIDSDSAAALIYALRRLEAERIRCLFALRLGTPTTFDLAEIASLQVERMNVGPLSLGAAQRVISNELGVTYPRTVIRRLVETSGGNPFYALELARGLERAGAAGAERQPLPEALDALVAARLGGVSPEAEDLIALLCLLPSATLRELERLGVLGALDETVAAGLVRVDAEVAWFTHPLLAAGAQARLGPDQRRRRHEALAAVLEDPVESARHLADATLEPSGEAAEELATAAETAAGRGLPSIGAELAEAAVRLTPEPGEAERVERTLLAARLHAQAGAFERARELAGAVMPDLPPGDQRAGALSLRARVTGDIVAQRELLRQALDEAADPSICAEANALLVRNYLYTGELAQALAAARDGDAQARLTGEQRRVAAATTTLGLMQIWGTGAPDAETYERALALIRAGGELPSDTYSNPHTLVGARALYRYELDEARRSYVVGASAADAAGDVDSVETFWWGLAQLEVRAGRYALAHEYVERIRESGEGEDWRPLSVRWIEGVLATYDGRANDARTALDETLRRAEAGENWFFVTYTRSALAFLEFSLGRADAAIDVLEPVLDTPLVVGGDPGQTGVLPIAAEALVQTRALDRAAAAVELLEGRGRALNHSWCLASAARCKGLLLAEERDLEGAVAALEEAVRLHDASPAPFERARTLLALGGVQRRARQRRAARASLEEAQRVFQELGTPLWLERAQAELGRIGGRAPSRGELTPNETRIAQLVSEGKTNKEVAAELFVTDRTVESALTQIYRKLDVRSRTELARRLAENV